MIIMTNFTAHTIDTAPAGSKPLLEGAQSALGFVPNLFANMAEAPALLEGYMTLAKIFESGSLTSTEAQVVTMTNNVLNGCGYCMAAHTVIAKGQNVPEDVVNALRDGTPISDAKLEALRTFTTIVHKTHGAPTPNQVQNFLDAGYTQQTVLDVVLGTALKVMSNYTNAITGTQLDDAFKPAEWTPNNTCAPHTTCDAANAA